MNIMQKKRDALINKLREDFSEPCLIAVMGYIFQIRRERAGISADVGFRLLEPSRQLDEFLQSASLRQLKMLRTMANGMKEEIVTDPQLLKEADNMECEEISEVVQPPTKH